MTTRIAFGAGRSIWTALVRRKAEWSFLHAKPRSPLDADDGAGNADLTIAKHELAGVAESEESTGCITLWIARAFHDELAVEDDRVAVATWQ
jgi:hypothetical protein